VGEILIAVAILLGSIGYGVAAWKALG